MICRGCEEDKLENDFPIRKDRSNRRRPYCHECQNKIQRVRYEVHRKISPFKLRFTRVKTRAKSLNLDFDLTPEYLESIWTGFCPITKEKIYLFERERSDESVAELDRFVPSKGYIKGNVHFLSRRMNRLKNNVTSKELEKLLIWMKENESQ